MWTKKWLILEHSPITRRRRADALNVCKDTHLQIYTASTSEGWMCLEEAMTCTGLSLIISLIRGHVRAWLSTCWLLPGLRSVRSLLSNAGHQAPHLSSEWLAKTTSEGRKPASFDQTFSAGVSCSASGRLKPSFRDWIGWRVIHHSTALLTSSDI